MRSWRPFFAIFAATRRFMRFSADLEPKNAGKIGVFFGACFGCGAFVFPTRRPLILLAGAVLWHVFGVSEKHVFPQKQAKNRA